MSSIVEIKMKIKEAGKVLDAANMQYTVAENEFLQAMEAKEDAKDAKEDANNHIHELYMELEHAESLATELNKLQHTVGTKYKWTHNHNPETYRVAIQTKKGVLQVKSVTDGVAETHEDCGCSDCWEFENNAPWRRRKPLKQVFFDNLMAWDASLPENQGRLVMTSAPMTDKALKALCMKPIEATEDALKLKELEERFPGGVFVLSTPKTQFEISYRCVAEINHQIYYAKINMSFFNFSDYCGNMKMQLMVEWKGLYIDLSHLF